MFYTILLLCILLRVLNKLTCGYAKSVKCLVGKTAIVTGGNTGDSCMSSLIGAVIFLIIFGVYHKKKRYDRCVKYLLGKTAIVTGGSTGLGFQISLILASKGCRVIIACRRNADEARSQIIRRTGNPNIITHHLDQSNFDSVQKFAEKILQSESRLDFLINNAGIGGSGPELTQDGFNETMQTNYLSPFLLTYLLKDLLAKSSPSRVVFTTSIASYAGRFESMDKCFKEDPFTWPLYSAQPYSNSKLALILACKIFAEKWKDLGIHCYSVHPGTVHTEIFSKTAASNKKLWMLVPLARILILFNGKSEWEGAQTTIHVTCSEETENDSGEYYQDCIRFLKPWQYYNKKLCKELWNYTIDSTKLPASEKI